MTESCVQERGRGGSGSNEYNMELPSSSSAASVAVAAAAATAGAGGTLRHNSTDSAPGDLERRASQTNLAHLLHQQQQQQQQLESSGSGSGNTAAAHIVEEAEELYKKVAPGIEFELFFCSIVQYLLYDMIPSDANHL